MTRPKHPVSSYSPKLHTYLAEGTIREVRIKCDSEKFATRLMQRLNALRKAMKDEEHSMWKEYYRCGIHRDHKDRSTVILAPRDSEFDSMLPDLTPTSPLAIEAKPPSPADPTDQVEDFLSDLRKK